MFAVSTQITYNICDASFGGLDGAGGCCLRRTQDTPDPPRGSGCFPPWGQRGTDVDLLIRGRNLQGATQILFATPKISATIRNVEHNAIRARFHVDQTAEP